MSSLFMLGWLEVSSSLGSGMDGVLIKVAIFIAVQALLYLILISSSAIFSKRARRRQTMRLARMLQILNVLSDFPSGPDESSPSWDYSRRQRGKKHPIHCTRNQASHSY